MCGTSFGDVKPPKSVQHADVKRTATAAAPIAQAKPAPAQPKPAKTPATSGTTSPTSKPQTQATATKSTARPATAATLAANKAANKAATESINTPIKNAGSIKKPAPLYASKPRFGLGSLVALVFVAAFAIAAIVFGLNALNNNTPAAPQPAFTLDVTPTFNALPTDAVAAPAIATQAPADAPTAEPTFAPTDALIESAPVMAATEAPTESPAATVITEATAAPSPSPVTPSTATPMATAPVAPSPTPAATATAGDISTGETVTYTVKGGDTCGKIAKQFGITVAQIIQWNNLDSRCFLNVNKVLTVKQ
jgi:LysM repeat protein